MELPGLAAHYGAMARYNAWMNERLYAQCATLSDAERRRELGVFFGSIHGTLNHLLLTDRAQLARFGLGDAAVSRGADGSAITVRALDQELYADFAVLRRERAATDAATVRWAGSLDAARLAAPLRYRAMVDDRDYEHPLWWAVSHFFNHQTHHRGQVSQILDEMGVAHDFSNLILGAEIPAGS